MNLKYASDREYLQYAHAVCTCSMYLQYAPDREYLQNVLGRLTGGHGGVRNERPGPSQPMAGRIVWLGTATTLNRCCCR